MLTVLGVRLDIRDDDFLLGLAHLVTKRAFDLELVSGAKSEMDVVDGSAGHPAGIGDTGDGGEPHSCCKAHRLQDRWHGLAGAYRVDIPLKIVRCGRHVAHLVKVCLGSWVRHVLVYSLTYTSCLWASSRNVTRSRSKEDN